MIYCTVCSRVYNRLYSMVYSRVCSRVCSRVYSTVYSTVYRTVYSRCRFLEQNRAPNYIEQMSTSGHRHLSQSMHAPVNHMNASKRVNKISQFQHRKRLQLKCALYFYPVYTIPTQNTVQCTLNTAHHVHYPLYTVYCIYFNVPSVWNECEMI